MVERPDLQVLWKLRKAPIDGIGTEYVDTFTEPLVPFLKNGRVKLEPWLDAEPTALMQTGHIVASVHHGGAGCYHEALGTGVPRIVLPQWIDHYSFAQLAETTGVGVWGCRDTSPYWRADCLRDAISTVLGNGEEGRSLRQKASAFGSIVQKSPGQYTAAHRIAQLAGSGY
ncbi:hypothetical protein O1611_g4767 [Lasiodiplodia mahajangana]|uniref:Uncharacterized protein n=1 Tax=Lasiodiplodia mahajangana TaxID=1108764 RepID=A0ACC2JN41_9PEZI|nr:hypothetical protein O1611_g4767 [Lasiodiplodia mahajangana]